MWRSDRRGEEPRASCEFAHIAAQGAEGRVVVGRQESTVRAVIASESVGEERPARVRGVGMGVLC